MMVNSLIVGLIRIGEEWRVYVHLYGKKPHSASGGGW